MSSDNACLLGSLFSHAIEKNPTYVIIFVNCSYIRHSFVAIGCRYHVFLLCIFSVSHINFSIVIEVMKYSCHDLIQLIFLLILLKLSYDMPY